ncbi:hypothetical protein [Metabacillus litoralis]|uniref:hypothetical protein n=1 Tax=Metabacillus litoralis TaxID=152268 RepID=UPI001CFE825F|nr:hypothetical protein [Metabacillus litoralis]
MAIHKNDLYKITKDSIRYKSLSKQYCLLVDSMKQLNNERDLNSIDNFVLYLTIYTKVRKINRIQTKHFILFARNQIQNCHDQPTEVTLKEVVKTLTTLKEIHKLNTDVSLMNYKFWCEVFK